MSFVFASIAGMVCLATASLGTAAQASELDILSGQTIRAIIGSSAGGGTDTSGRAFLTALGRVLPETTIRIQNLPGGSGAKAIKEVQEAEGGLITIGIVNNGPIYAQLQSPETVPFDVSELQWIGSLSDNQRILGMRKAIGEPKLETLLTLGRQPITPVSDVGSSGHTEALLLNAFTDLQQKIVPGMEDDQRRQMIIAGDSDLFHASYSQVIDLIESGDVVPVLKFSKDESLEALANIPSLSDVARPTVPRDLLDLIEIMDKTGRLVAAAPSADPATVGALRAAFAIVVADPQYERDLEASNFVNTPTPGSELADRFAQIFDKGGGVMLHFRAYLECGQKVSDGEPRSCE
jgi:tripartite-type tricarboxylate transporter receptor subunit TctC